MIDAQAVTDVSIGLLGGGLSEDVTKADVIGRLEDERSSESIAEPTVNQSNYMFFCKLDRVRNFKLQSLQALLCSHV